MEREDGRLNRSHGYPHGWLQGEPPGPLFPWREGDPGGNFRPGGVELIFFFFTCFPEPDFLFWTEDFTI